MLQKVSRRETKNKGGEVKVGTIYSKKVVYVWVFVANQNYFPFVIKNLEIVAESPPRNVCGSKLLAKKQNSLTNHNTIHGVDTSSGGF